MTAAAKSTAITTNTQRQSPPFRKPKAAPVLWMFTSLMTPGMSAFSPTSSGILSDTQYLSHWSAMSTRTTANA